jgi:hypothetical protein
MPSRMKGLLTGKHPKALEAIGVEPLGPEEQTDTFRIRAHRSVIKRLKGRKPVELGKLLAWAFHNAPDEVLEPFGEKRK